MDVTKVVLVTGGNRDMGLETCHEFDALGLPVLLGCLELDKRGLIDW